MNKLVIFLVIAALAFVVPHTLANEDGSVVIKLGKSLEDYWHAEKKVAPKYPQRAIVKGHEGCATVGYIIEADGSTSNHWVIASHPENIFDRSAIKANKKFEYTRGNLNQGGKSVMTINTFTYMLDLRGRKSGEEFGRAFEKLCKEAAIKVLESKYGPVSQELESGKLISGILEAA